MNPPLLDDRVRFWQMTGFSRVIKPLGREFGKTDRILRSQKNSFPKSDVSTVYPSKHNAAQQIIENTFTNLIVVAKEFSQNITVPA